MRKVTGFTWAAVMAGAVLLLLVVACGEAEKEVVVEIKEVVVEKEVVKEVPVEKIVEKEVIKQVPVEVVKIKEVPVEKIVEKEVETVVVQKVEVPVDREVVKEVIVEVPVEKVVTKTVYQEVEVEVEKIVEVEVAAAGAAFNPSGEVVSMVSQTPVTLDAWRGFTEVNGPGYRNVTEQLIGRSLATGEITPYLATSWEVLSPTVVQFELREGLTHHDGTPFNAESAAVALNFVYDPVNAFDLLDITGPRTGEAVGEYTLKVTTPEGDPLGLQKIEFMPFTSAKQIMEGKHSEALIGTGPYSFIEWRQGEGLFYEANPDWWGINNPQDGGGVISFEKASYRIVPEAEVRMAAVLANEIHVAQFMTPEQCKSLGTRSGASCQSAATVETIFLRLDGVSPLMRDVRVRQALLLAIDQETIASTILGGAASLAGQIVNQTALGHNPNLAPYPFDPDYARFLFNEAKADGVPVDEPIRYHAHADVWPFGAELVTTVANMFRDVGFTIADQLYVGTEMDDLFVTHWDGCNEIACPNVGTTAAELDNRNAIMMHQHGNEILDFAYSYGLYFACGAVAAVGCYPDNDALWQEAIPLEAEARDAKLQELMAQLHKTYSFGFLGHVDFMYGVNDNLKWQADMNHRLKAIEMSPR